MKNAAPADAATIPALEELTEELARSFEGWAERPVEWPEQRIDELARRAFALQWAGNEPYRRYCERLQVAPDAVRGWRDVPPVPTPAFREVTLLVGGAEEAALDFRTSGTTGGRARRGRHLVRDPKIYQASLTAAFFRFVLAHVTGDTTGRLPIASLVPPFRDSDHSSLSWMAEAVIARFGAPESCFLASPAGIDWDEASRFVALAADAGEPVCLFGTTLAFDAWTRRMQAAGDVCPLPRGSVAMDTGGPKGVEDLSREGVLGRMERHLGLPPSRVVNEYGMTELLSQRYGSPDSLAGPPWLRSRALDPVTLAELPPGAVGVLHHFDLANVGSVCSVLTEDLGAVEDGAIRWVGRAPGAPPRGCSLATAELLRSHAGGSDRRGRVPR